ncbi:bleomycin resistance protein [Pseudomonas beijingensis]|jgi:catechol 2,3-dioxygenase-like lactoylglutathione lyase family enzyme|uniref:Bleomycin resistance protein n=1 Tax=Pseudomonas beijingensis TaxID=2954101 RepID=A0ABY9FDW5_9PSED|nr:MULTISPECIES: VOC family protein [unclassified Pseudomonas]WLH01684.1 VOC family protein [Pseudomonas sp. FP2034]WLI46563.1 VOC family protein [Pseudomonas sp. FP830]
MVTFNKLIPELIVSDIKASSRFYCKIIGFSVEYERPNDGFMFISYHGSQLMLEQDDHEESPWRVGPLQKPYGRGMNLSIDCPDVRALAKTLIGSGYELHKPIEECWYKENNLLQGQSNFLVLDPDGYLLRFAQYLGSKSSRNELR